MKKSKPCNYDRDNELNQRMNSRYFPSATLKPNLETKPHSTKYSFNKKERTYESHVIVHETQDSTSNTVMNYNQFTTNNVFFPGNRRAPVSHILDNIDMESTLRNQYEILEKKDINQYMPNMNSQLYNVYNGYSENDEMIYKLLPYKVQGTDNKKCQLAPNDFFNTTRMNVKNI